MLHEQFLAIIRSELVRQRINRSELARRMGCSRQMVTNYLNGRIKPGPDTIDRFCAALDVEPRLSIRRRRTCAMRSVLDG